MHPCSLDSAFAGPIHKVCMFVIARVQIKDESYGKNGNVEFMTWHACSKLTALLR